MSDNLNRHWCIYILMKYMNRMFEAYHVNVHSNLNHYFDTQSHQSFSCLGGNGHLHLRPHDDYDVPYDEFHTFCMILHLRLKIQNSK